MPTSLRSMVLAAITQRYRRRTLLLRLGLSPQAKILDLNSRVRCCGCGARERAIVSASWGSPERVSRLLRHRRSGQSDEAHQMSPAFRTQIPCKPLKAYRVSMA